MDKVMKAEIEKELANECYKNSTCFNSDGTKVDCLKDCAYVKNLSSSLTSLIIKWLEGKKAQQCLVSGKYEQQKMYGRNQLITELIGGVR